jgi:Yip1-like protein
MTEPQAVAGKAGAADMVEIYYAPSAVFERRRNGPWGLPLIVLAVVAIVLFLATSNLMRPVMDAEMTRAMAAAAKSNPNLKPEQIEAMKAGGSKFAIVGIGFFFLIGPLLVGLILWVVGKIVGAKQELAGALAVGVFAFYPRLIEMIINAVQAAFVPEQSIHSRLSLSLGLGRFMNPDSSLTTLALLGRVDVFTLWVTVLLALGLKITGRTTTGQAIAAGVMMWVIGALPGLLGALRAG